MVARPIAPIADRNTWVLVIFLANLALFLLAGCASVSDGTVPFTPGTKIDSDNDALSDDEELHFGTDPNDPDSDGDGTEDGGDSSTYCSDPNDPSTCNTEGPDGETPAGLQGMLGAAGSGIQAITTGHKLDRAQMRLDGGQLPIDPAGTCDANQELRVYSQLEDGGYARVCADLTSPTPEQLGGLTSANVNWPTLHSTIDVKYFQRDGTSSTNVEVNRRLDGMLYFSTAIINETITLGHRCGTTSQGYGSLSVSGNGALGTVQWNRIVSEVMGWACNSPQPQVPPNMEGAEGAWERFRNQ